MKSKRQLKIIELVNKYDIETQEELVQRCVQPEPRRRRLRMRVTMES